MARFSQEFEPPPNPVWFKQYHTIGLMGDYWLSKRTDVYLQGAFMKAAGDQTGSVLDYGVVSGSAGVSSSSSQLAIRAGIRHKF